MSQEPTIIKNNKLYISTQMSKLTKRRGNNGGKKRRSKKDNNSQQSNKRMKRIEESKEFKFKNKSFTEEAKEMLKLYIKLKSIYEDEGMTQKTHQFLTRITQKKVNSNTIFTF